MSREALPLAVAAAAFMVAVGLPASDPDTYWHLASGKWMVEERALLRIDLFSSTVTGRPYAVGQWLGEIVLYLAYAAGSWLGLAILRAGLVALAAFALTRIALRSWSSEGALSPSAAVAPRALVVLPLVGAALVLSKVTWTDRPQLFTLALFPVLLDLLLLAREGRSRALFAVPPLMFVWSQLHGGYALGIALLAIFTLAALIERRPVVPLAITLAASAALALQNPGAVGLPAAAVQHVTAPPRFILEESPPDALTPAGMLFAAFVVATFAIALRAGGGALDAMLLAALLWLALSAQRHMPFFAFVSAGYLAGALARAFPDVASIRAPALALRSRARGPWERQRPAPSTPGRRLLRVLDGLRSRRPALALAGGLWAAALLSSTIAPTMPDERGYPAGALAALRVSSGVLLNEYDWGGYLIWHAPERLVFVDGRLLPFLPEVIEEYRDALRLRPRWRELLERRSVAQALLQPGRALAAALREDGWTVAAQGSGFVLLERPRGRAPRFARGRPYPRYAPPFGRRGPYPWGPYPWERSDR